jgi:hypothetical protein
MPPRTPLITNAVKMPAPALSPLVGAIITVPVELLVVEPVPASELPTLVPPVVLVNNSGASEMSIDFGVLVKFLL